MTGRLSAAVFFREINSSAMSFNRVLLDDECVCFQQEGDLVRSWHETLLGSYLGEEETMFPEQACAQLYWFHKSGYQVSTQ